jgi:hypothetical protein
MGRLFSPEAAAFYCLPPYLLVVAVTRSDGDARPGVTDKVASDAP